MTIHSLHVTQRKEPWTSSRLSDGSTARLEDRLDPEESNRESLGQASGSVSGIGRKTLRRNMKAAISHSYGSRILSTN